MLIRFDQWLKSGVSASELWDPGSFWAEWPHPWIPCPVSLWCLGNNICKTGNPMDLNSIWKTFDAVSYDVSRLCILMHDWYFISGYPPPWSAGWHWQQLQGVEFKPSSQSRPHEPGLQGENRIGRDRLRSEYMRSINVRELCEKCPDFVGKFNLHIEQYLRKGSTQCTQCFHTQSFTFTTQSCRTWCFS